MFSLLYIKVFFLCSESATYFTHADNRIGGRYKKAMFVEYTDDTFTTKVNRTASEMHLGFLGPVIRAEVGDEIKVLFKNQVITVAIKVIIMCNTIIIIMQNLKTYGGSTFAVATYMLWCNFVLGASFIFLCLKLITIHYHTLPYPQNKRK